MTDVAEGSRDSVYTQLASMAAQVAALHASNVAEIAALKRDTEAIRISEHEVRNMMQNLIARMATEQTVLKMHMQGCEVRGTRLERVAWGAVGIGLAILGFLLKLHFVPGHL
jgi:hypothetical protein